MTAPSQAAGLALGIDLTPLARGATGIGTYVRGLLSARANLSASSLVGFVNVPGLGRANLDLDDAASNDVRIARSRVPRRFLNQLWLGRGVGGIEDITGPLDVFHATDLTAPSSRAAALVLTVHDLAWRADPALADPRVVRYLGRWFEPSLARAESVIVPSRATASALAKHFGVRGERVAVVPHGVTEPFRAGPEPRDEEIRRAKGLPGAYLLMVAPVDRRKDWAMLVEGYRIARGRGAVTAPLVLVGPDAGAEADLARLVEKAHLGDAVLRLGRVPTAVLPALYRGARLVLYLSRCEGFGLPVLEAMACGAPLVASRIPALEEVAGDAARWVTAGDAGSLARAIEAALEDSRDTLERRDRGIARAAGFTWERTARLTAEVYRRSLRTRGKNP